MFKVWKMPVVFGGGSCDFAGLKLRILKIYSTSDYKKGLHRLLSICVIFDS